MKIINFHNRLLLHPNLTTVVSVIVEMMKENQSLILLRSFDIILCSNQNSQWRDVEKIRRVL